MAAGGPCLSAEGCGETRLLRGTRVRSSFLPLGSWTWDKSGPETSLQERARGL